MKYSKIIVLSLFLILLSNNNAFSIEDVKLNSSNSYVAGTVYTNDIHSDFTLEDCIKIAINNNLTIQSAKIQEDVYKTKIGQHWAKYFPELNAAIDYNRAKSQFFSESYNSSYLPQVSASLMVFDFGKAKANADSAKRTFESKKYDTNEKINILICNVKKAYYNLQFAKAQYAVYQDTVDDFEMQKRQAYALYKAGKKAKVDVAIADYNLCKAKWNFIKAKNSLKISGYELSRILGFPEYNNYNLTSQLDKNLYEIDIEEALSNAYKVRPELLSAEKSSEAAKMKLRAKRRELAPDVKVNAGYGNTIGTYHYNSYQLGGGINYSALNLMKTKKEIDEAKFSYKQSQVDLENLKQDLYLSINKSYSNMMSGGEAIEVAENALEQAKEQYRQTTGRYKAGIADIIELKDGENAYLNARLDYYNTLLNYNISLAEFEKEIGAPLKDFVITK